MTGEIRDFSKPNPDPKAKPDPQVQILSAADAGNHGVEVEVRQHETLVVSTDSLRHTPPKPGDPEIRIRQGDPREWEAIKRGDED